MSDQQTSNYWIGPYGIKVPNDVNKVKQEDGANTLYKNGSHTEMVWQGTMTKEDYLAKYAVLGRDGTYYYKK